MDNLQHLVKKFEMSKAEARFIYEYVCKECQEEYEVRGFNSEKAKMLAGLKKKLEGWARVLKVETLKD